MKALTILRNGITLEAQEAEIRCACGPVLMRMAEDTRAKNLRLYCRKCKREWVVNIVKSRSPKRPEP